MDESLTAASPAKVRCWIYRGGRNGDAYLFVPGSESFEHLPRALLKSLGRLEFAMELELSPARRLARADPREVIAGLRERGYYLQLPPVDMPASSALQ